MIVGIIVGVAIAVIARWLFETTREPIESGVDAAVEQRRGSLVIVLRRVDNEHLADITLAQERDRTRWN